MKVFLENVGYYFEIEKFNEFLKDLIGDCSDLYSVSYNKKTYSFLPFSKYGEVWIPVVGDRLYGSISFNIKGAKNALISYPKKVGKQKYNSLYSFNTSLCPLLVEVPNSEFIKKFKYKEEYFTNLGGILSTDTLEIYKNEDEFYNQPENENIHYQSIFPIGIDIDRNLAWINGVVKKVFIDTNKTTNKKYYCLLVDCNELEFMLAVGFDSINNKEINVGDIISGQFALYAKIHKKYKGFEYGHDIKPIIKTKVETIDEFFKYLIPSLTKESAHPETQNEWNEYDCFEGQCAVVAMLVQDYFGGELRKIKFKDGNTHYFNYINGKTFDLSSVQFSLIGFELDYDKEPIIVERSYCESNEDTVNRYEILKKNFQTCLEFNKRL